MKGLVYPHFIMVGKDELISHMWSNRRHMLFSKIRKLVLWRLMICVFSVPNKTSSWTLLLYSYRHDFIPVFHWFSRRLSIIWKRIFWEKIVDATIAWSVPFKNGENNFKESIGWTKNMAHYCVESALWHRLREICGGCLAAWRPWHFCTQWRGSLFPTRLVVENGESLFDIGSFLFGGTKMGSILHSVFVRASKCFPNGIYLLFTLWNWRVL